MLDDIGAFFQAAFSLIGNLVDFVVQIVTSIFGLLEWTNLAGDTARKLVYIIPWDIATLFMAMVSLSILFVFFGRIK